jgi:iron complex outermembrane receptor protein
MAMKRVALVALALWTGLGIAGAGVAPAQDSGRIEGRVARQDGTDLPGVSVRIDELEQVVLTNSEGGFAFEGVPAGSYTLTFSLVDRSATEPGVEVTAGGTTNVEKTVDWDVSFAETITVTSVSRRVERIVEAPAAVTVVSEIEIEREAAHGQLPKLLEFTPGAEVTQSGIYDFNFNTRGFNSSLNRRIATFIDGRDPSVPFLGAQEWGSISFPLDDLASAELVRGPSSALYGANAYNGVLNLTTKSPRDSQGGEVRLTAGELNTTNADLRWASELATGWYSKLVAGYRASDDFSVSRNVTVEYPGLPRERIPLVLQNDNEIAFGGLRLDRYFGEHHLATIEGGYADLKGPVFQTGIGRVQLTDVQRPWGRFSLSGPRWNLLGTYNRREANDQRSLAADRPLYLDDENFGIEFQAHAEFAGGKGRIVGGLAYSEESIDSADPLGVQTLVFAPVDSDAQAVFAQVDYDLTDRFKVVLAARYDESSLHDAQFSPKGSLVFGITPNQTLRASYNEAFQVANYSEFFLQAPTVIPGTTTSSLNLSALENALRPLLGGVPLNFGFIPVLALGNEDLELEEIQSYELGYSGIFGGKLYLTADYYQNNLTNFITDLLANVGTPLGRLNSNFGPYAPPPALSAQAQAAVLAALRANLPASLFALLSNNVNGAPIIALASYTNFGEVDTQGVDLGVNYYVSSRWVVDFSYSWFDFEIQQDIPGDPIKPNSPENQVKAGLTWLGQRWDAAVKYRWVDDFEWFVGPFRGLVPSYDIVDLTANFAINDNWKVGANVSNALDEEHYETFGGDILGRRALGYVSFAW